MVSQTAPAGHLRGDHACRILGSGNFKVSFEFFPPQTAAMHETLWRSIRRLEPLEPTSVAITYGAGGGARDRTHATVSRILRETSLRPAAHLTCVAATRVEIDRIARNYWDQGVRDVVALRGDPPKGSGTRFVPTPGGYDNTIQLIRGVRAIAPFNVTVAGYPEKHPESPTFKADIDILRKKIDAGASRAITQFFFDNMTYLRYLDRVHAHGICVPIVPGIIPLHNFRQVAAFSARVGVSVPPWLSRRFDGLDRDPETHRLTAAATCAEQVLELVDHGVNEFHFYTLNRADLVYAICHMLGLRGYQPPITVEPRARTNSSVD